MKQLPLTAERLPDESGRTRTLVSYATAERDAAAAHHHDVRNALRRIDTIVGALKQGYRFDDAAAPTYVQLLEEALATLDAEAATWAVAYP